MFDEVRLPVRLAFGSTGGVERRTEVVTLASGHERRWTPWSQGRRKYLIGAGLRSLDDMAALTAFFGARQGRLRGFRFRDIADYKGCGPSGIAGALDQQLGEGDGQRRTFALVKAYGQVMRVVTKPESDSVRVAVGGLETQAFEVDPVTGVVTLDFAPHAGVPVTAGFRFDVPVRFDTDRLDVTLETFEAGRMAAVPLVEVRGG